MITHETIDSLTDWEVLVLYHFLRNKPHRQIAIELGISLSMVKQHISKIYAKFYIFPRTRTKLKQVWYMATYKKKPYR